MIPKTFKVYCSTHEVYIPYCNAHRVFERHQPCTNYKILREFKYDYKATCVKSYKYEAVK